MTIHIGDMTGWGKGLRLYSFMWLSFKPFYGLSVGPDECHVYGLICMESLHRCMAKSRVEKEQYRSPKMHYYHL